MKGAYYQVLSTEHQELRSALALLFEQLDELSIPKLDLEALPFFNSQEAVDIIQAQLWRAEKFPDETATVKQALSVIMSPIAARATVAEFVESHSSILPPDAAEDVLHSYSTHWRALHEPVLVAVPVFETGQDASLIRLPQLCGDVRYIPGWDTPDALQEWFERVWQPTKGTKADFRAQVRALHTRVRELRPDLVRYSGWHREPELLSRFASRLYRRVVLNWSWQKIAARELEESPEWCDTKSVRFTVQNWARSLRIPLPENRRGRPRKSVMVD